jgi:hypothetical protein
MIYTLTTINGSRVDDCPQLRINKSLSDLSSSSNFTMDLNNYGGYNTGKYQVGDEIQAYASMNPINQLTFTSGVIEQYLDHTGDTGMVDTTERYAQTFTVGVSGTNGSYFLGTIHLWGYSYGSPGYVNISMKAVDGSFKPTGADLSTGSFNANLITSGDSGQEIIINMSLYELQPSTQYAIIMGGSSLDIDNQYIPMGKFSSSTYAGGSIWYSNDNGATWGPGLP